MARFVALTLDEFADLLTRFPFTRVIDGVHMHHTWRPNHAQWRGEDSVEAMRRYHVEEQHWSDIAQHVTIAPDGLIWTGRNWNAAPASASGYNGNASHGPFMFETVGDFDTGRDRLEGAQRAAVIGVIARVQRRFGLPPEALRFHNMMTDKKSCPGTSVSHATVLAEVGQARAALDGAPRAPGEVAQSARVAVALRALDTPVARGFERGEAELPETDMSAVEVAIVTGELGTTRSAPSRTRDGRRAALTPAMLTALRPHVVDLNQGRFSSEGIFRTQKADVDAIFDEHLERETQRAAEAKRQPRIVFWAHGGLIDEASGLEIAHLQVEWWRKNEVYPIHFVWETGLFDALQQILAGTRDRAARDLTDLSDAVIERMARSLGGGKIWSAMKRSAELAVALEGGARYVAERLRDFCGRHPEVELHAVGHSAGSIFHAHFLPMALELGVPPFKRLQLLAPAIRTDAFKQQLLGRIGDGIGDLTMYTMARDWEEADNVVTIYRKSLLYLIHFALEPERESPILGLEVSVRQDPDLKRLFGLDGAASDKARVVWAVTEATTGRSASTSQTHGGFDNDRPTMNSVAARVRDGDVLETFPQEAVERALALGQPALVVATAPPSPAVTANGPAPLVTPPVHVAGAGSRRALCVGINAYATQPLHGCVADMQEWAATLAGLGFRYETLVDDQAVRQALIDRLHDLIATSRAGDIVVFQYAGHGTRLDDLDGDEPDQRDEALCPIDMSEGAFLLDDDVSGIMAGIPDGVNVTCFIDCCHSGSATRVMVGPPARSPQRAVSRPRYLVAGRELQAKHAGFRAKVASSRAVPGRDAASMRNVVFSACQDAEVAWETNGHGEFTVRATQLLRAGVAGVSHEEFQSRVLAAFGPRPRQTPRLDCAPGAHAAALFGALVTP